MGSSLVIIPARVLLSCQRTQLGGWREREERRGTEPGKTKATWVSGANPSELLQRPISPDVLQHYLLGGRCALVLQLCTSSALLLAQVTEKRQKRHHQGQAGNGDANEHARVHWPCRRGTCRRAWRRADWRLPRALLFLGVFPNRDGVTVFANLTSKGCVRPADTLIGAREVSTFTGEAFALTALINVRAYGTLVQDEAFRAFTNSRRVRVTVCWARSFIAEHFALVRFIRLGCEAWSADASVVGGAHWLALKLAVRSETRIQKLHALSIHQLIAIIAEAFEAALGVNTELGTWIGPLLTVIHVLTPVSVCSQLVACLTHTGVRAWHFSVADTKMLAEFVARLNHRS